MIKSKKSMIRESLEKDSSKLENRMGIILLKNNQSTKTCQDNFTSEYKFYFPQNYELKLRQKNIDLNLDWKYIKQIEIRSLEQITCSICLSHNKDILIPRILKCNHIFCLPCIINHFVDVRTDCPVCGNLLCLLDLKRIIISTLDLCIEDKIDFVLMKKNIKRKKISFFDSENIKDNFLSDRDSITNDKFIMNLMSDLERFNDSERFVDFDNIIKKFAEFHILKSIESSQNKIEDKFFNHRKNKKIKTIDKLEDYIYFYQHVLGYKVFLDTLDFHFLIREFQKPENLPLFLKSVEIQKIEKNSKKKINHELDKYFSHVGHNNVFYLINIKLINLVSSQLHNKYLPELHRKNSKQENLKNKEKLENDKKNNLEEDYLLALQLYEEITLNPPKIDIRTEITEKEFVEKYEEHYPGLETEDENVSFRIKNLIEYNSKRKNSNLKKELIEKEENENEKKDENIILIIKKKKKRKKGRY